MYLWSALLENEVIGLHFINLDLVWHCGALLYFRNPVHYFRNLNDSLFQAIRPEDFVQT
jgi:hypothetical protein